LDAEARNDLQARLLTLSKILFWNFVVLLAFLAGLYTIYPEIRPKHHDYVWLISAGGVLCLVALWKLLQRRQLSTAKLRAIDAFYSIATGTCMAAAGAISYDLRPSAYISLIYACLMVLLRSTIVPSTGKRTAVIGVFTCLPMLVATVALVYLNQQDIPGPAYVAGAVLICVNSIGLAVIGSNILYGLRRQVTEALQLGQYMIDHKIGEGGNGAVYRAHHALLRRPTAVKVILPQRTDGDTIDRFEREVQLMSRLTHPNTVAVFDYGRSPDGRFYYAMEYLDGIDLENLVERYGRQPADRVVAILLQVCGALREAHGRGLIHRDIKPANIILCQRGAMPDVAKVVDFGLVKEIAVKDGGRTRGIMGTPAYIAPESVTDPDQVSPASDLYALGAVAYFLVTGKRVFEGKTSVDVCVQHVTATPVPPSQVVDTHLPRGLEELILRCLAKQPKDRPASAAELAALLRAIPPSENWSEEDANRWWTEFEKDPKRPGKSDVATITVDLAQRSLERAISENR
jgi:eukaryotic-like serine/threonine-protein kinase